MQTDVRIEITEDLSSTLFLADRNEHYHSVHGAVNEALIIYIEAGLKAKFDTLQKVSVFEMGLGTGLNAFLTWIEAEKAKIAVDYVGIEAFPLPAEIISQLNYGQRVEAEYAHFYACLHACAWEEPQQLSPYFQITKLKTDVNSLATKRFENAFDLIYYDAFAPEIQPELWETSCFQKMYAYLKPEGVLTTYCAKGQVKRNLKASGFSIEGLPGPVGKREITRGRKIRPIEVQSAFY